MSSVGFNRVRFTKGAGDFSPVIYLDIVDLLAYVRSNITVSGIQRVVVNLIADGEAAAARNGASFVLVAPEYDRKLVYAVDSTAVQKMLSALDDARLDRTALDRAIDAVYSSRELVFPAADDVFVIAGAFWIYSDYDILMAMRRRGVRVVAFIHDLIQISHPEFVHVDATERFRRAFVDIASSSAGLLTNSHYVAQDTKRFLAERTTMTLPVSAVPLATELPSRSFAAMDRTTSDPRIARLLATPYVLSVSTIEIRKNHSYMVKVWEELIASGDTAVPDLVFVGKIGWDIDPFISDLARHENLGGKLHILSDVGDEDLATLYRHAAFTMYMSFVEGFGLPVAESLAYGVPCIASDRSSMPEVGGDLARYLDPHDISGGVALVRRLLMDPDELAHWRAQVVANFRVRTWAEFTDDFVAAALSVPAPQAEVCNARFASGEIHGMGRWEVARRDARGESLGYLASSRLHGWGGNDDWGCWAEGANATLVLATDLAPGDPVTVQILVKGAAGKPMRLGVRFGEDARGDMVDLGDLPNRAVWRRCNGTIGRNGTLALRFDCDGDCGLAGYFALLAIAFARSDDIVGRMAIVETLALDRHRMASPARLPRRKARVTPISREWVDPVWYLETYPDVQLLGMSAEAHFEWLGRRLGRRPNGAVD